MKTDQALRRAALDLDLVLGRRVGRGLRADRSRWFTAERIGSRRSCAGVALTLVYMFVVVPFDERPPAGRYGPLFVIGFLLNAAWGIGWALFLALFERLPARPLSSSRRAVAWTPCRAPHRGHGYRRGLPLSLTA